MEWRKTISDFLDYMQNERHASANTVMAYRNDLTQFADHLSATLPEDATWSGVTVETLGTFVDKLAEQKYTASTSARKIAALKTLFHWMMQRGIVSEDPAAQLRSPKVEKRSPRLLSEDEMLRLFEATARVPTPRGLRDRALLEVIYSTGMRVSEAISLRLSDIDLDASTVKCAGRGTRQRIAPLTPQAATAVRIYMETARTDMLGTANTDYVFLNPLGTKLTRQAVWQLTRQYANLAGIEGELTPHTLRHSRAAHMLNEGQDIKRVQEWLGHANLATTQMYRQKPRDHTTTLVPVQTQPTL
jgi:integrase/recombinase XerD